MKTINRKNFALGQIVATPNAIASVQADDMKAALARHAACDWGDCCSDDWQENDFAVDKYLRLFSVYHDRERVKFWIITEADRSATTILLPVDY